MKRINVIGTSGSGKSTFARLFAEALDYPYIEMDALFWKSNWGETSDDEFFPKISEATKGVHWVLDGNYSRSQPFKWARADTVIWIDYSWGRTAFQAFKRAIYRAATKQELWPGTGNRESFQKSFFSRDSIILWMLTNYQKNKVRYEILINSDDYSHIKFIRLKSPAEAREFIKKNGC